MKQYLLSVHHPAGFDYTGGDEISPEEIQAMVQAVDSFNTALQEADAWVFAGGLQPPETATTVRTEGGEVLLTDGPFAEAKEYIGGFWIIQAADLDAAIAWATRATDAVGSPIEVRPLQEEG